MADIVFEDDGELRALVLDATVEEIHRASAQATEQPVERGVDITDHVRPERRTLTLAVVISDTPLRANAAIGGDIQRLELDLPPRRVHAEPARRSGPATFEPAELEERAARPGRPSRSSRPTKTPRESPMPGPSSSTPATAR